MHDWISMSTDDGPASGLAGPSRRYSDVVADVEKVSVCKTHLYLWQLLDLPGPCSGTYQCKSVKENLERTSTYVGAVAHLYPWRTRSRCPASPAALKQLTRPVTPFPRTLRPTCGNRPSRRTGRPSQLARPRRVPGSAAPEGAGAEFRGPQRQRRKDGERSRT
jgi:hypothetical protein